MAQGSPPAAPAARKVVTDNSVPNVGASQYPRLTKSDVDQPDYATIRIDDRPAAVPLSRENLKKNPPTFSGKELSVFVRLALAEGIANYGDERTDRSLTRPDAEEPRLARRFGKFEGGTSRSSFASNQWIDDVAGIHCWFLTNTVA
jgi:hypothetical protein